MASREMMDNKEKDDIEGSSSTRAPKRVAGGIVVKAKKKKKKCSSTQKEASESSKVGASSTSIPSILSNIPTHHKQDNCNSNQHSTAASKSDEFEDTAEFDDNDVPSDALLCFQTLTQSTSFGGMSETCAYCPIYTHNEDDEDGSNSRSTTAVPFLPRHILLYILNKSSTTLNTNTRTHIEQEIKQLAVSNKVRLLQLHGTAMISNNSSGGYRGDGNDDEDVAIMEFSAYNIASKMALEKYFQAQQTAAASLQQHIFKVDAVHSWFTTVLLPYFAGKTWFSSGALDNFYNNVNHLHSLKQMEEMIQQLVHAGVLMPRRGVGPSSGGGEGYWFSLPGLGKAAKSIVDGRTNLLRRLQSSLHKEKKRSTLEFEIGRIKSSSTTNKNKLEQAGKFVVLEMLAKGLVGVHKTCTGEQLIRLVE